MSKPKKVKEIKPIKALLIVGADGLPNWSLHRLEIYGVMARAKENKGTFDKIIPILISPIKKINKK